MAVQQQRPDIYVGVAFNGDPFDANTSPQWTDLTQRVYSINSAKRGRQYELDRNQAGALSIDWHNADEALNPVNTSSPYSPNVVPYRRVLVRAVWPPGGAGNMINQAYNSTDGSFENYGAGFGAPGWLGRVGGVTPTITATTPFQGTRCVTYTVASGPTLQGLSWTLTCIPGRTYTVSAYVRQSSASTQEIQVVNVGAANTNTTTTGAYVRLTATFTALQPTHTARVVTIGTAVAGTVFLDAIQHELGGTATTFNTTPVMIRNIWTQGYIERWPIGWLDGGFRGVTSTPGVGPLAILNAVNLHTEVQGTIMFKTPTYCWPLQEESGAVVFAEASGNNGPPLRIAVSPIGLGSTALPAAGTASNIAGDPSGTGVTLAQGTLTGANSTGALLGCGASVRFGNVLFPTPNFVGSSWGATAVIWVQMTLPRTAEADILVKVASYSPGPNQTTPITIHVLSDCSLDVFVVTTSGGSAQILTGANTALADGKWHLVVATVSQISGGNTTIRLYIDGVEDTPASPSVVPTSTLGLLAIPATEVQVGGRYDLTTFTQVLGATVAHLALYSQALTQTDVTDLWNAGKGYAGELESARINRHLVRAGYNGPAAIQPGVSVMGPSTVKEGDTALAAIQQASDSAFGNFFENADGIAYASRNSRYLQTTAAYTFGERVDLGEYPYEGDIIYDLDPTQVLNIADITRSGGVKVHAEDGTGASQKRYGKRTFTRTIDIASDNETIDAATWTVANRKSPLMRVSAITFSAGRVTGLTAGDGSLWPMVLNLEIGTRVTVKRRPKAANGGAGITMSGDFYVESIEHHGIDSDTGEWFTTLLLSPAPGAQPWILENSVYGVLDSTTVLGF